MKLKFLVTVELDYDLYHQLLNKGYNHMQIYRNVRDNIRNMFSALYDHWYCAIRDIEIEEVDEENTFETVHATESKEILKQG